MDTATSVVGSSGCPILANVYSLINQHWHGIFQNGSNWADGPVGVTQCPISPGHSFLYQFDVPDQAGTFWYHSHFCKFPSRSTYNLTLM